MISYTVWKSLLMLALLAFTITTSAFQQVSAQPSTLLTLTTQKLASVIATPSAQTISIDLSLYPRSPSGPNLEEDNNDSDILSDPAGVNKTEILTAGTQITGNCYHVTAAALMNWRSHCTSKVVVPLKCFSRAPSLGRCCDRNDINKYQKNPTKTCTSFIPKRKKWGEFGGWNFIAIENLSEYDHTCYPWEWMTDDVEKACLETGYLYNPYASEKCWNGPDGFIENCDW